MRKPKKNLEKESVVKYKSLHHFSVLDIFSQLPKEVQNLANKNYGLLKDNPRHPSLHFKKIGELWSVRIGKDFRALGFDEDEGIVWF